MQQEQRQMIEKLRGSGYGYKKIALTLGISENTIKSFCKRNNIGGKDLKSIKTSEKMNCYCLFCGKSVEQKSGRKQKKFCSDKCRNSWWNKNLDKVNRKANYEITCLHCGKVFSVYGNAKRKYCSHSCYITDRFGGGHNE